MVNVVSKLVYIILVEKKWNQKPCIKTKKVINRGKKSKRLSNVKPAENIIKNPQSFLEISPVQKEVLSSRNLRDHTTYK